MMGVTKKAELQQVADDLRHVPEARAKDREASGSRKNSDQNQQQPWMANNATGLGG